MEYTVKLPVFEGPFDLLFHLVKKAEVDIWQISIAEITEQYLAYLRSMQELNLEIASEFLVMAATLLRLKSKLLLPRLPAETESEEEEEMFDINSPEELFRRLDEYRRFKLAAHFLREREAGQQKIFLRSTGGQKVILVNRQQSYYACLEGPQMLAEMMRRLVETAAGATAAPVFSSIEDFVINDRIDYIIQTLKNSGRHLLLKDLVQINNLWEIILTFIAVLELARQKRIQLLQDRPFGSILVSLMQNGEKEEGRGKGKDQAGH